MISYYILISVLAILAIIGTAQKKEKKCLFFMMIVITLFQGLRWNTGADWQQYLDLFQELKWNNWLGFHRDAMRTLEPGYGLLNVIIKSIFGHYSFFLLITCGFINFTYLNFVTKHISKNKSMCYLLILSFASICPVRNTIAGVILVWGIDYIIKRDWKKFLFVIIVAMTIHYASIIALILFYTNKRINKYILLFIYTAIPFISKFINILLNFILTLPYIGSTLFSHVALSYNEAFVSKESDFSYISFIIYGILFVFCLYYRDKQNEYSSDFINVLTNMTAIVLIFDQLSRTGTVVSEINRISYYCIIGFPILLVLSLNYIIKRSYNLRPIIILFLVFISFYKIGGVGKGPYADVYVPYYNVFEHSVQRDFFGEFYD